MTFTALSADGTAVWGARQLDRSDKEIVDAVQKDLSLGDVSGVFYDLDLPSEASGGAVIRWSSSHSQVVSAEGKVQRPAAGAGDAKVTLTAQITKGKAKTSKTFDVTVLQQSAGLLLLNYPFSENEGGSVIDNSDNGFHGKVLGGVEWNEKSRQEAEWTLAARTAILNCRTGLRIQRTLPLLLGYIGRVEHRGRECWTWGTDLPGICF